MKRLAPVIVTGPMTAVVTRSGLTELRKLAARGGVAQELHASQQCDSTFPAVHQVTRAARLAARPRRSTDAVMESLIDETERPQDGRHRKQYRGERG